MNSIQVIGKKRKRNFQNPITLVKEAEFYHNKLTKIALF